MNPCPGSRHGTASAYNNWGCRCPVAVRARTAQRKTMRLRPLVPSCGARRRIRALMWMGWDLGRLRDRLDIPKGSLEKLLTSTDRIGKTRHDAIAAMYDELWDTPGPSQVVRSIARSRCYPPPMAWDDDTIDDPDALPQRGEVETYHERLARERQEKWAEARRLTALGLTAREVAARLNVTSRTVVRARGEVA